MLGSVSVLSRSQASGIRASVPVNKNSRNTQVRESLKHQTTVLSIDNTMDEKLLGHVVETAGNDKEKS